MIALVKRRARKMHLASRHDASTWTTICDRDIDDQGAEVIPLATAVGVIDERASEVCAHCHRLLLMADVVHRIGVGHLLTQLEVTA